MAVSKRLRYEVMRRDNFTCRYCGKKAGETELTIDHVVPVALGGDDQPTNLVTACAGCNAGKSASSPDQPLVENVSDDALRWSKAMERAAAVQGGQRDKVQAFVKAVDAEWCDWKSAAGEGESLPRPANWESSLENFYRSGLTVEDVAPLIKVTMTRTGLYNNKLWRYFCGCCWNLIRERQAIAEGLLAAEDDE